MDKKILLDEVAKVKNKYYFDQKVYDKFVRFIKNNDCLVREHNPDNHVCSFFLPYDEEVREIFLGHHKKADDWIPPGGHVDPGEYPLDTVYREFKEELTYKLTSEKIELFDLTVKNIANNPRHQCKWHYDFWYVVYLNKRNFSFDKNEFYQAEWLTFAKALKKMKLKSFSAVIRKLANLK